MLAEKNIYISLKVGIHSSNVENHTVLKSLISIVILILAHHLERYRVPLVIDLCCTYVDKNKILQPSVFFDSDLYKHIIKTRIVNIIEDEWVVSLFRLFIFHYVRILLVIKEMFIFTNSSKKENKPELTTTSE